MIRFIPISIFSSLFTSTTDLLEKGVFSQFLIDLHEKGEEISVSNGYEKKDFQFFIESIKRPSAIVFHGWIAQEKYFTDILNGNMPSTEYLDNKKQLSHQLIDDFKSFISPYLSNALLSLRVQTDKQRKIGFYGAQFLTDDERIIIENHLFQPLEERLQKLKDSAYHSTDEKQILTQLQPLCNDDVIACVNYLSRRSYDKKVAFIDGFLTTLKSNGCTPRLANWTLKQLEKIEVNPEHREKIIDLKSDLQSGKLQIKNTGRGTIPIRWSALLTALILLGTIGITGYILIWKKAPSPEKKIRQNQLIGLQDFTIEERKKIDSLLKTIKRERPIERLSSDSIKLINKGMSVYIRSAFHNKKMKVIYDDLVKDLALLDKFPPPKCLSSMEYTPTHNTPNLNQYKGSQKIRLKNNSEYDLLVYLASQTKKNEVYTALVKAKKTINFTINKSDILTVVAGKKYQKFQCSNLASEEEVPSALFTHHFCERDANYAESINRSYQFVNSKKQKIKLLFTTDDRGFVHLMDIHDSFQNF